MKQLTTEILVLEEGQALPLGAKPPRQPKWYDTFTYIANPEQFCRTNLQKYGPVFRTGVFGGTTIFVGSAPAVQMVFNGDLKYTEIALPPTTMDMFGEYSLFQRPDLHRQRKNALGPGLTGRMLDTYTPQIDKAIAQGLQAWVVPGRMAMYLAVEKICFDIFAPLLLGVRLDERDPITFAGLPVTSKAALKNLYKTFYDGFYGLFRWESRFTSYGRGLQARAALIDFMRAVVRRRRTEGIDSTSDFLTMMLAIQQENPDGVFSDDLIENQCLLQMWASHYEVSGLVCSLIYKLGQYPLIVRQLRQEQVEVIGEGSEVGALSSEQLKQMVLLEATIKETLRVLPPSSTANRRLTKSVVVDGVLYEKGCAIIAEPRIAHMMPEHFPEPQQFVPERFLPERGEGNTYEFIPFGGGVHACLGAQLAMLVTKAFAARLLRQFDWQLTGKPKFVSFPLMRIADNYQIDVERR